MKTPLWRTVAVLQMGMMSNGSWCSSLTNYLFHPLWHSDRNLLLGPVVHLALQPESSEGRHSAFDNQEEAARNPLGHWRFPEKDSWSILSTNYEMTFNLKHIPAGWKYRSELAAVETSMPSKSVTSHPDCKGRRRHHQNTPVKWTMDDDNK